MLGERERGGEGGYEEGCYNRVRFSSLCVLYSGLSQGSTGCSTVPVTAYLQPTDIFEFHMYRFLPRLLLQSPSRRGRSLDCTRVSEKSRKAIQKYDPFKAHPSQPYKGTPCGPCRRVLSAECLYTLGHSMRCDAPPASLAVAAVPELSVFGNLQFGGVGGGDAVAALHGVALLQLRQSAHQASIGCIQRGYALLLHEHKHRKISIYTAATTTRSGLHDAHELQPHFSNVTNPS